MQNLKEESFSLDFLKSNSPPFLAFVEGTNLNWKHWSGEENLSKWLLEASSKVASLPSQAAMRQRKFGVAAEKTATKRWIKFEILSFTQSIENNFRLQNVVKLKKSKLWNKIRLGNNFSLQRNRIYWLWRNQSQCCRKKRW